MDMITKVITKRNWEIAKTTREINKALLRSRVHSLFIIRPSFKSCGNTFQS